MRGLLVYFMVSLVIAGCSAGKGELYKTTDGFVESLDTTYESYGLLGGSEHSTTTSDGRYRITPVGRLINVKIQHAVSDREYEKLRNALARHYRRDRRVNDVYICQAGTVMIDCRN